MSREWKPRLGSLGRRLVCAGKRLIHPHPFVFRSSVSHKKEQTQAHKTLLLMRSMTKQAQKKHQKATTTPPPVTNKMQTTMTKQIEQRRNKRPGEGRWQRHIHDFSLYSSQLAHPSDIHVEERVRGGCQN